MGFSIGFRTLNWILRILSLNLIACVIWGMHRLCWLMENEVISRSDHVAYGNNNCYLAFVFSPGLLCQMFEWDRRKERCYKLFDSQSYLILHINSIICYYPKALPDRYNFKNHRNLGCQKCTLMVTRTHSCPIGKTFIRSFFYNRFIAHKIVYFINVYITLTFSKFHAIQP